MIQIKTKAICLFRHQDRILVAEYTRPHRDQPFYRPLGGTIEHGENSELALQREIYEELQTSVKNLKRLGVIENIYENQGQKHEILFIFDGELENEEFYMQDKFEAYEMTSDRSFTAVWKPITDFIEGPSTLYPEGLLDLIIEEELISADLTIKPKVSIR